MLKKTPGTPIAITVEAVRDLFRKIETNLLTNEIGQKIILFRLPWLLCLEMINVQCLWDKIPLKGTGINFDPDSVN